MKALRTQAPWGILIAALLLVLAATFLYEPAEAGPNSWLSEWPKTDFERRSVDLTEIMSGGPPKTAFRRSSIPSSARWPRRPR